ncbi:Polypyrimidine tract-binding protein 1 [Dufourea novaeangliae]|uniref:Polypyrimidine tract-binding protein 1 n=1 Tax=Dufourea novaeangliae TaxID=178035 RepID=A0A154P9L5_DUFNO|nr:Polypyrimidine tract-binding protein 1 [Dufourea novaeangliae]
MSPAPTSVLACFGALKIEMEAKLYLGFTFIPKFLSSISGKKSVGWGHLKHVEGIRYLYYCSKFSMSVRRILSADKEILGVLPLGVKLLGDKTVDVQNLVDFNVIMMSMVHIPMAESSVTRRRIVTKYLCNDEVNIIASLSALTMRGSDELLSQSGAVSNGAAMSPQPHHAADNNNDAKKVKLDKSHNSKPSRVIHIRNIPNEVSVGEIVHLGAPFGRVTNVLVLKGKNQAFLEMADENVATAMVAYYATCIAQLRGRIVYVQFSNHRELKTDQTYANNAPSNETPRRGPPTVLGFKGPRVSVTNWSSNIRSFSQNSNNQVAIPGQNQVAQTQAETQGGPNTVLRVIVEQMVYPISLDVLYQFWSQLLLEFVEYFVTSNMIVDDKKIVVESG